MVDPFRRVGGGLKTIACDHADAEAEMAYESVFIYEYTLGRAVLSSKPVDDFNHGIARVCQQTGIDNLRHVPLRMREVRDFPEEIR